MILGPDRPDLLRHETLPDLLEATAARTPAAPALRSAAGTLAYAELNAAADRVAHHLLAAGVEAGSLVGLWAPRGPELLVLQAGIAKAGAGWLPFDADTPLDRITTCLEDAATVGLVVADEFVPRLAGGAPRVWPASALAAAGSGPLRRREGLRPEHTAYVIYTSGSTGKPKGIAITHASICHFLRSENTVLGVRADDVVYQGFSVAFDMSFEEIWIAYLVGACLWVAPREVVADADALAIALERERISVLHAVPTLLALLPRDVTGLRLINLGGEACPEAVVERFATPERELFNTYGPTEATVSASVARLERGQPVSIGTPLPNYGMLVVGEQQQALSAGEVGELCLTGPGVAAGYLGRPALTAEKFIANPWATSPLHARMYRTGDLARIHADGAVHLLGRADDQVKVRGFRVELGEIDAALDAVPGVGAAAVLLKPVAGVDQLVAYFVAEPDQPLPTVGALRLALRARLPAYMLPSVFVALQALPRLTSGKIDRKALRALPGHADGADAAPETAVPAGPVAATLYAALRGLFPGQPLAPSMDFFDDLGGHSLLAARLVSVLRADAALATASVQDIYRERRLAGILTALEAKAVLAAARPAAAERAPRAVPRGRRLACGLAQLAALPMLIALKMSVWLSPFFVYHFMTGEEDDSTALAVAASAATYLLASATTFAVAIAGKWAVAGRLKAGRHPLWGLTFFRFWLAERLAELPPLHLLSSSPLHVFYLRALGARIGRDVTVAAVSLRAPDLLAIADGASIGSSVNLENAHVDDGELVLGCIAIGRDAYVGSYCALEGDTAVGDAGVLEGLSALAGGARVPAGEVWHGAPARFKARADADRVPPRPGASPGHRAFEVALHTVGASFVAVLFFVPVFPGFMLIDWLDEQTAFAFMQGRTSGVAAFGTYVALAIPASAVTIVATVLLSAAMRWAVLPRLKPGRWSVHSALWHRKWLTNQIQEASLAVLHGLYATVYAPWWYRILGARIGRGAEISTAMGVVPDMLTLGDDSFIADRVMLGDEDVDRGWVSLRPTVIGHRSFVGNGAYIPDGTRLPDDVLIGVQSGAPANTAIAGGDTWLGSPPLRLPAREPVPGFASRLTFAPTPARRLGRGAIEALRVVLPLALIIAVGYVTVLRVLPTAARGRWVQVFVELGAAGLLYGVGSFALVLLLKWTLIGRYRASATPMWTLFVWVSEAVTNLYESIAVPNFMNFLRGTPWLGFALRMLGARIGHNVYLDTTDLTEFDCVRIGDGAVLNAWSGPQTHLFEDRVMKIGKVDIGAGVQLATRSVVLYGARVGDRVRLGPLTLVSKGEDLPAGTRWHGSPASAAGGD